MESLAGAAATICSVVLLFAGALKIPHREAFASQIATYQVVPVRAATPLGHILPFVEILASILILSVPRVGGPLCAVLFLSFALAVAINLIRGRTELVCGCFGRAGRQPIRRSHVVMNVVLACGAVLSIVRDGLPSFAAVRFGLSAILLALLFKAGNDLRAIGRESYTGTAREARP
jgi:Methylamine utilisation protein MauE